jgi:DNA-binding transcriptional LysR family regulator
LAQFSINNPKVAFMCSFSDEAQMLEQLCEGALDLALTTHQSGLCNDVENQQVFDDVIDLVVPAEHAWAKKGRISPKELAGTALILRDPESTAFATVYESLLRAGLERNSLNSRMILDSEEAIVLSVLAGLGPGFASRRICEMLGVDSLSQVRIDGITIIRPIYLQRLTRRADHPVISAFWDSIAAGQATIAK